jgi:hypothetical protein
MELLKVFVGDGAGTGLTVATMVPGDLLLLDAATYSPLAANTASLTSKDVVIASCISKNGVNTPVFSTPIKKTNIKYISAVNDNESSVAEATATAAVGATALVASTTYSIGVQIKEDLRMGTYNKNTEIIGAYTTPATIPSDGFVKMEMASTIAKGFAANPLTSAGSPSQLVSVFRPSPGTAFTGVTTTTQNLVVTRGSRQVSYSGILNTGIATGLASGPVILNLGTSWYLVEKVDTPNKIITLDTAFQGTSGTVTAGISASSAYFTTTLPTSFTFEFDGVAQTQKNRFDQFRMVDFVVITPKGNDAGLVTITATAPVYPVGSFRQIRDLEEKAYTNSNPLINYREFPSELFPLNATSGTFYCILTVAYTSGWGYNMMQSNQAEFLQTAVIAAPFSAEGQFDVDASPANAVKNFLEVWNAWAGAPTFGSYTFS